MQKKSKNVGATVDENQQNPAKSSRSRKKNYYNAIRKQMEFYFGDANLSKDRFLRQLIETDPYVPLDIFMTFNKIKTLAKSVEDIALAVKTSEQLDLNQDSTGVRRRAEIPAVHDADDKTIYVEQLPQDADHDWVRKAFSRFGKIAYVSLPKYKNSKRIKEFGFVEFENDRSVEKAIKGFEAFDGVLGYETAAPERLTSVRSYLKEQKKAENASDPKPIGDGSSDEATDSSSSMDSLRPPSKRFKSCDVETPTSEIEAEVKKKKRRKHRKKSKFVEDLNRDGVPDISQMKIATKKEWKRLRNKYLNLQREKIAELKRNMQNARGAKQRRNNTPRLPIHRSPHNMNFYQDRNKGVDKDSEPVATVPAAAAATAVSQKSTAFPKYRQTRKDQSTLHYESGLIIRLRLDEPCVDVKELKNEMRQHSAVKYVDVKEGAFEAHLRCESRRSAQLLLKRISGIEYAPEILMGSDEEMYWNKIMQDRADKFNNKVRVRTRRGREKVIAQLPNHVRFDED